MKIVLFGIFLIPLIALSQTGWNYLPGAPVAVLRIDDISFINDSTGWSASSNGNVDKTTDGGNTWITQLSLSKYLRSVEFLNDSLGFVGSLEGSVYKTLDGGNTWIEINSSFPQPVPGVCGIGHLDSIIIMVGIWSQPAYILRSTDYGTTWGYHDMSMMAGALIDCWFKSRDTVFVSGQGTDITGNHGVILRSTDGGITWEQVGSTPALNTYCWKLDFPSSAVGYSSQEELTGNASHIMKTTDGGSTWISLYVSNQNIDMEGIGFANDTLGWVGGHSSGMYQTTNGGDDWTFYNFGNNINRFTFLNPNLGYASGTSIYKFTGVTTGFNPLLSAKKDFIHNFDLFPNPASGKINITLRINRNTKAIFEIYDNQGRLLIELANTKLGTGIYHYEYNMESFNEGNYYVVLRTNEHFLTKSFMAMK